MIENKNIIFIQSNKNKRSGVFTRKHHVNIKNAWSVSNFDIISTNFAIYIDHGMTCDGILFYK